jgi:hypothetical protein
MAGRELALTASSYYRRLRRLGITPRGLIDCFIAAAVIAGGHVLLHNDRDFHSFEQHLGLRTIHP